MCVEMGALLKRTGAADRRTLANLFGSKVTRDRLLRYAGDDMERALGPKWWRSGRQVRERLRS